MYVALGADPIKIGGRPPPITPTTEKPEENPDLVPSWARGVIAIGLVGGALVFLLRVAEENEKFLWRR
jgi:hypothetical protein